MKQYREQAILAGLLVVFAIATRVIFNYLHVYNFNAVMAAGLFAGAYLGSRRIGLVIPFLAMLATDAILGFYDWKLMAVVYGSLAVAVLLGKFYAKDATLLRWIVSVLGGSLTFFVATNLAVWIFGDGSFYPHTLAGLETCFAMAVPFYRNTMLGDLTWSTVLFGSYQLVSMKLPKPATVGA
jgi:hypothetical protein